MLRAYRATAYRFGGLVLRVGCRSAAMDAVLRGWGHHQAAVLGAWNPRSRRMPEGWNRRRHAALCSRLRGIPVLEGSGTWRGWREAHVLAALPEPPARRLGLLFRQAAILLVARGRPVRLVLLTPIRARS